MLNRLVPVGAAVLLAACAGASSPSSVAPPRPPVTADPSAVVTPPEPAPTPTPVTSGSAPTASAAPTPSVAVGPAALTDEQLVGQLFMGYVYGSGAERVTAAQRRANMAIYGVPTPAAVVQKWHLGGVILIDRNTLDPRRPELRSGNIVAAGQVRELTAGLQSAAEADSGVPLLIATDEEGGRVQRLRAVLPRTPAQADLAPLTTAEVRCHYVEVGEQLRDLGISQDFAPVADVVTTQGGVIGDRSFGADPREVATDVVAATDGLQSAGVLATLKHWPGHGATSTDSHTDLAVVPGDAARWRAVDLPPFAAGAPSAAAVMVGHLALPAIDASRTPATLSAALVDGELRGELGYDGLVVTDSLWMRPMLDAGTPAQVARRAIDAGNDMLLQSPDVPSAHAALVAAVREDAEFRATVTTAVRRILAAKERTVPTGPTGC